jgi:hypothetical protein
MLINYFASRDDFIDACYKRQYAVQVEEDSELLAFSYQEYMGAFNGTDGFLLDETMVKPTPKTIFKQ